MDTVLTMITWLIGKAAESGAGFFSWGAGYQPEIPEELIKQVWKREGNLLY